VPGDSNVSADARNMTNGNYAEQYATGTDYSDNEWIQMDLNGIYNVKGIVIGCDWDNTLQTGWGKNYTEYRNVEYSLDGKNWTFLFETTEFTQPIQVYQVNIKARYIRIINSSYDNLAVTEFYAI